jgi:AcrR family transcriptional regulator
VARTRPGLNRDAILAAALRIIDESGLDACTMRAVATDLGVEAMSLYWHVPGKDALLDGVVELVLREVETEQGPVETWQEAIMAFGHTFRGVLLRHPRTVQLLAGRPMSAYAAAATSAERALGLFADAGFDTETSVRAVRTMGRFVVGSILLEFGASPAPPAPRDMPALADLLDAVQDDDPAALLRFGLETMIAGLEARLRQA